MARPKGKQQERIDFLRANVPELGKIDPFLDLPAINRIKAMFADAGLYRKETLACLADSTIINLILKAQGKEPANRGVAKRKAHASKNKIFIW